MPYEIVKSDKCPDSKPYAVVKKDGGKVMGCHPSEAAAKKQMAAIYVNEGDRSIRAQLKDWVKKLTDLLSPIEEPSDMARTVIRQMPNGQYRWLSVSATSTLNRVKEIDSRELFDSFKAIADATGKYPKRDIMHLGLWGEYFVTGQCDFMARDGNVYVTSGVYNDSALARAEIESREAHPEYWGDSIAYQSLENPDVLIMGAPDEEDDDSILIFKEGVIRFISTVPEALAASHYTRGSIQKMEVDRMWKDLDEATRTAFTVLFKDEAAAQEWWEANPDDVNRAIEESGMLTRTVEPEDTEPEPEPAPEEPEEAEPVVERVLELDDEMIQEIVSRAIGADEFTTHLSDFTDRLDAFQAALDKLTEGVNSRLQELEKSEEEKERRYLEDLPRRELTRVTHRPREENAPENDRDTSSDDRAEIALEGWSTERYKEEVR